MIGGNHLGFIMIIIYPVQVETESKVQVDRKSTRQHNPLYYPISIYRREQFSEVSAFFAP